MVKFAKKQASIMVATLLATSVIAMLSFRWWRCVSMSYDIVVAREEYYRDLYTTEGVLFSFLRSTTSDDEVAKRYEVSDTQAVVVTILRSGSVQAELYRDENPAFSLRCRYEKGFISHYTIGAFL